MNNETNVINPSSSEERPLNYVIYARKSTEDNERQYRSIKDQITDCQLLAKINGLKVAGTPFVESKSAKVSGIRPIFKELLKQVKKGEIDGIIAWHPDRLSRNMLEGSC
jgi:DNA invertase Pin-like site-specific DNA recombinase